MLLTVIQAAKELGVAEITLRRVIRRRLISYRRIGGRRILFSQEDINLYLESVKVPAAPPTTENRQDPELTAER